MQLIPENWSHQRKAGWDKAQLTLPVRLGGKTPNQFLRPVLGECGQNTALRKDFYFFKVLPWDEFPIKTLSFRSSGDQFVFIAPYGKEVQGAGIDLWTKLWELPALSLSSCPRDHRLLTSCQTCFCLTFLSDPPGSAAFSRLNSWLDSWWGAAQSELPVWSPWVLFEESFLPLFHSWWDSVKPWPWQC